MIFLLLILILFSQNLSCEEVIPRIAVVMYNADLQKDISYLNAHQLAEMPLNHLGIQLRYHKIQEGYPSIENDPHIIGILSWFEDDQVVPRPDEYIEWVEKSVRAGKKFVMMGALGFSPQKFGLSTMEVNRLWRGLGLSTSQISIDDTYNVHIEILDPSIMNFERNYDGVKPPYERVQVISPEVHPFAYARYRGDSENDAPIACISPSGGYVMKEYACYKSSGGPSIEGAKAWYINPFEFFRRTFGYEGIPIPDTTTLAGRRIYYSHIDGDGWNNVTQLHKYRHKQLLCPEVLYYEILTQYPHLPVTVAPIGADIDLQWLGIKRSREIAKKIFALPHIEAGSHTFTHPFDWLFFKNYIPEKEVPYLSLYPDGSWKNQGLSRFFTKVFQGLRSKNVLGGDVAAVYQEGSQAQGVLAAGYAVPRAYALEPFNANLEVIGSIAEANQLTPKDRPVKIIQWSGNCLIFEKIMQLSKEAGVQNINGGDSRFDQETFSYGWVKSIGRQVGSDMQIYSSCANENIYTSGWTNRYWGQVLLQETFKNTETPWRIKPMNLYYHMFSLEQQPSFSALLQNLSYIEQQRIIPVSASHFSSIAQGFYSMYSVKMGIDRWQIFNRGKLQTIRFDKCSRKGVDFSQSHGVIGQKHLQGSLYVYLDAAEQQPIIVLKELTSNAEEPVEWMMYLLDSRWPLWELKKEGEEWKMKGAGYGPCEMRWRVPQGGNYHVRIHDKEEEVMSYKGFLEFKFQHQALEPVEIAIKKK